MSKITWPDKIAGNDPSNPQKNISVADMAQIKGSVNELYDLNNHIEFEVSIPHTTGTPTRYVGTVNPVVGSTIGAGVTSGNLVLTPASVNWKTLSVPAVLNKMAIYSNALAADVADGLNKIVVYLKTAHKTGSSSSDASNRAAITLPDVPGFPLEGVTIAASPVGTLNNPLEIHDSLTLFGITTSILQTTGGAQLGIGGTHSRSYFILGYEIDASCPSKTYKFKIVLTFE